MPSYLSVSDTAKFLCLSRGRIEQLLREPKSKFPRPFQPAGAGGRRCFKVAELEAWMQRRRASY
jgi:excisionase family DNA binding protein